MSEFDLEQMGDTEMLEMITPPWWLKALGGVGFLACLAMAVSFLQGAT